MNKNVLSFNQPEGFPHLNMIGYRRLLERDLLNRHRNPGIEIIAPMKGNFQWWVEGQTVNVRPGEISVTLPWQEHGGHGGSFNVGELCWLIIGVDWEPKERLSLGAWSSLPEKLVQNLGQQLANTHHPITFEYPEGSEHLMEIFREIEAQKSHHTWKVNRIMDDLLFDLHRLKPMDFNQDRGSPPLATGLQELLQNQLHHPWSLEEISQKLSQSPSKMNRDLREETGYSTMEFVSLHRIEHAKILLKDSQLSITQIALDCGFRTSQYFSSVFKKWVGISPLRFRDEGN